VIVGDCPWLRQAISGGPRIARRTPHRRNTVKVAPWMAKARAVAAANAATIPTRSIVAVSPAKKGGLSSGAGEAACRSCRGEPRTLLEREEKDDRPRGQRQPDKPAAHWFAPAPAGQARSQDQQRRNNEL